MALISSPCSGIVDHNITKALLAFSFVGVLFIMFLQRFNKAKERPSRLPPGPRGLPFLGSLPFVEPNLHRYFTRLAQAHGPVFSLRLGSKLCVVVSSPSAAREIFKDQDAVFANRNVPACIRFAFGNSPDLLWSPNGSQWRRLRKLAVSLMLNAASMEAMAPLRRREVRRAVAVVCEKARSGSAVEVRELMFQTTLNTTTSMLWGERVTGDENWMGFRRAIEEVLDLMLAPNVADYFPILAPLDPQRLGRRVRRHVEWLQRYMDGILERRKKAMEEGKRSSDVLEVMLEMKERGDPQLAAFTWTDLKNFFSNIIGASTDSNTTTMEWALNEMLKNKESMRKAQQELDDVVGKARVVEESDIPQLHYLGAVVKEILRLHPPVPLLVPHCPSTDCRLGGFSIPAGTAVFINAWAIHRNPSIWKDSTEFKPERFLEGNEPCDYVAGNGFCFLPFGAGRRVCAGIMFAEKMIIYSLASLLHSFNWWLPEGVGLDLADRFGFVLRKAEPLLAVPTMRLNTSELYA